MSHRTYRSRVAVSDAVQPALAGYAQLFARVERTLHARLEAKTGVGETGSAAAFKNDALHEFGLTGRQFNAIRASLDGKRKAVQEGRKLNIDDLRERIERLGKAVAELKVSLVKGWRLKNKATRRPLSAKHRKRVLFSIHQKSRRLDTLRHRLALFEAGQAQGRIRLCFGSGKLFRAQFYLEANEYKSHAEWLTDWQDARASQFMVLGSKDETSGCQGCVASLQEDGSLTLRVRLPQALVEAHGTHLELRGVRFAYGHEQVVAALKSNEARRVNELQAKAVAKAQKHKYSAKEVMGGTALTWRFLHDPKGWEVLVSLEAPARKLVSVSAAGRVAVDVNADHLAVSETDYHGNWKASFSVPCRTQGLTSDQAAAVIGDAVKAVMAHVIKTGKPLVLEKLDFSAKKRALKGEHPAYARMLSAFAYNRIRSLFEARAFDAGIEVQFVNPAFTSVIGRVKYSVPLGITTHEAAALAIARRAQGARERAPRPKATIRLPVKGGVTAWTAPDWMLPQHRTRPWRRIAQALPRLFEREPVRSNPAASVSGTRNRTLAVAGEAAQPPARA